VAVGCNDVLRNVRPSVFRSTYTTILEALNATDATVVAVGVPDLGSMMLVMAQPLRAIVGWAARRADSVVCAVATHTGAQYVSISGGQLSGPRGRYLARSLLSADRWHPNGDGYRIWAGLVAPRLFELLQP
jgi:lysophospholipase L1-like esterase